VLFEQAKHDMERGASEEPLLSNGICGLGEEARMCFRGIPEVTPTDRDTGTYKATYVTIMTMLASKKMYETMLVMLENFLEKALQSVPNSHPPKETVLS
jgi:hypothetical protein